MMTGLLGLCALLLAALPARAEPCAQRAVEVATLNTWGLPAPLSRQRPTRFARIRAYVEAGADAVGLQEVWSSARWLLVDRLRLPTASADSGLAVVTPHPSTRPAFTPFTEARGFDALKSKGAIATRIHPPDRPPFWMVVTHLQSGHNRGAARVRASQVRELLDVADALPGPAVVVGDFNLYDDLDADRRSAALLEGAGYRDSARAVGRDEPTWRGGRHRLDRIYVRDGQDRHLEVLHAEVPDLPDLSDHLPVEATVAMCPR